MSKQTTVKTIKTCEKCGKDIINKRGWICAECLDKMMAKNANGDSDYFDDWKLADEEATKLNGGRE